MEGQSWEQEMCFPPGKACVSPQAVPDLFQSASTSVILGLSFPLWNGRVTAGGAWHDAEVGRYSGRSILSPGRVAVGSWWSQEERPGLGDSRQVPRRQVMGVENRQPGPWLL